MSPPGAGNGTAINRLRRLIDLPTCLLALGLGTAAVVGASYNATDSSGWFTTSWGALLGSIMVAVGIGLVLYVPIRLAYGGLDRLWDRREGGGQVLPMRVALRRWLLPTFAVVQAGWLPWFVVHYPGNIDGDTVTQLFEWLGWTARTDHHPWFDTAIFGWFWDIGRSLGSYNIGLFTFLSVQEVGTALGMALALTYLGRLGTPVVARRILTVFVAAFPTFAMSADVMSKDSFAGIFWMPFFVLFVEAVRTRGHVLCRPWVGAAAIALTIPVILAKRPNVYVVGLCVIVLLVVAAKGTRLRLVAGSALVVVVTNAIWPLIVLPALGVAPSAPTDVLTIPLQQTARTVKAHGGELPASERAAIDAVLRYDGLAQAYVPRRSDAVKGRWNKDATTQQEIAYAKVWLAEMLRYPGTYLSATAANTFEYFAPVSWLSFQQELDLVQRVDHWKSRSLPGTTRQQIANVASSIHAPAALDTTRSAVNRATEVFGSNTLLASKALYASWIPFFALVFALRRRSWLHVTATVPLLINLAVLIAGPVALPRYIIPSILGSILIIGLILTPVTWLPARSSTRDESPSRADDASPSGSEAEAPAGA